MHKALPMRAVVACLMLLASSVGASDSPAPKGIESERSLPGRHGHVV
jgi:hypothetical protein